MRTYLMLLICLQLTAAHCVGQATRSYRYDRSSPVRDSTGKLVAYNVWEPLLASGKYVIKRTAGTGGDTVLYLTRLTKEEMIRSARLSRPSQCPLLQIGQAIEFELTGLDQKVYNSEELKGKIVVLNFWPITQASKVEIEALNELVDSFRNDDQIVFLSVSLNPERAVKDVLKSTPFKFRIISDGQSFANYVGLKIYPANIILDRNGKIYYHTCGMGTGTVYWLQRRLQDLEKVPPAN